VLRRPVESAQYVSGEYVQLLHDHHMIPNMSRPANPYDNASCESFLKTLKREEIYANRYRDLGHLRTNIEVFIEQYYNRARLHSALGYCPPEEVEQAVRSVPSSAAATMRFFQPTEGAQSKRIEDVKNNIRPTGCANFRVSTEGFTPTACANFVLKIPLKADTHCN